ncbi:hypothetical protein JHC09_15940 [Devosia sp. MC532]|uniref:hypothetical protein n=1 Tax=Devosia sp. MC532 TaxID=2799788 RepID=UPI0018F35280|nr:hypothetical protein [Devosia sp. MC532]MBJ7579366.1 hypothetical protein [Devosia sp. MC532]
MPETYVVDLPARMTQRGFWLYVWQVPVDGEDLYYVGRTGDNSSPYASSVYRRFGQHLGDADNTNALLKHLRKRYPEKDTWHYDTFRMIALGPIFPEVERHPDFLHGQAPHYRDAFTRHVAFRNRAAALEAKLARELTASGYEVLNTVSSNAPLDHDDWQLVKNALIEHFPNLSEIRP